MKTEVLFFMIFLLSYCNLFSQNSQKDTTNIDVLEIKIDSKTKTKNSISNPNKVSFYTFSTAEVSSIIGSYQVDFSQYNLMVITLFDSPAIQISAELKKVDHNYILVATKMYPKIYSKSSIPHIRAYLVKKIECPIQPQLLIKTKREKL